MSEIQTPVLRTSYLERGKEEKMKDEFTTFKKLVLRTSSLVLLLTYLSGCGRSNTLPPISYYPNTGNVVGPGYNSPPQALHQNDLSQLPSDATQPQSQFGSVVGQVVDANGHPLSHIKVSIEGQPNLKTRTNRGEFILLNVPTGSQVLVFKAGDAEMKANVNVRSNMAVPPEGNPVRFNGPVSEEYQAFVQPNAQGASFKVDQDMLNQWQPRGVVASGGMIYISAIDESRLFKKGTVIQVDAGGNNWKNIGKSWFGLRFPMNRTTQGLTITPSNVLLVVDEKNALYTVDPNTGKVQTAKADGALDIAAGGGQVYIYSNRGLERSDETGINRTLIPDVMVSGGIGADKNGNCYAPVGDKIKKVTPQGEVSTVAATQLNSPTDVAIDERNGDIYVLDSGEIKRYTANGEYLISFQSAAQEPVAIDLDEEGYIYVADFGTTHRNSQIIKFEPAKNAPAILENENTNAESSDTVEELPANNDLEELPELPTL